MFRAVVVTVKYSTIRSILNIFVQLSRVGSEEAVRQDRLMIHWQL